MNDMIWTVIYIIGGILLLALVVFGVRYLMKIICPDALDEWTKKSGSNKNAAAAKTAVDTTKAGTTSTASPKAEVKPAVGTAQSPTRQTPQTGNASASASSGGASPELKPNE